MHSLLSARKLKSSLEVAVAPPPLRRGDRLQRLTGLVIARLPACPPWSGFDQEACCAVPGSGPVLE
jgi:hypothetical protein